MVSKVGTAGWIKISSRDGGPSLRCVVWRLFMALL